MKNSKFSRIIAGAMTWGAWGKKFSTKQYASKIEEYSALGITTFDHADIYGGYTTEGEFGQGLKESGVKREAIQLISKCGIQYQCEARPVKLKHYDLGTDYIRASVEQSLRNLQTGYLDLLLLHRPSPLIEVEEVAELVEELKTAGKILSFGVSNFTASQLSLLLSQVDVDANQVEISLTKYEALNTGILEYHKLCDIQTMAWGPLGSVFKEETEQTSRIAKVLSDLSEKYAAVPDQLLLAWLLRHPSTISPVIGTTSTERAKHSLAALDINLSTEDWFQLLVASQGHKVP